MRRRRWHRTLASVLLLTPLALGLLPVAAASADDVTVPVDLGLSATTWQGGPGHDGHSAAVLGTDLTPAWSVPSARASTWSYPVISGGRVFSVLTDGAGIRSLVAMSAADGSPLWGPTPLGRFAGDLALDGGLVFVVVDRGVQAWDAATGALAWTTTIGDEVASVSGPPIVAGGALLVSSGGEVVALSVGTGTVLWRSAPQYNLGPPSLEGTTIVATAAGDSSCPGTVAFSAVTGATLWSVAGGCGPSSSFVQLHDGLVFVHHGDGTGAPVDVRSIVDGSLIRTATSFDAAQSHDGLLTFSLTGPVGAVTMETEATDETPWTSAADDYTSPTLTASGVVWAAAGDGRVDGLDELTGDVVWSSAATDPADTGAGLATVGLAAVHGLLVVPEGGVLRAWSDPTLLAQPVALPAPSAGVPHLEQPAAVDRSTWGGFGGDARHDFANPDELTSGAYTPLWSVDVPTNAAVSQPVIAPEGVFFTVRGVLHGYARDGTPLWPALTLDASMASLSYGDGVLFVSAAVYGTDEAVDAATGAVLWTRSSQGFDRGQVSGGAVWLGLDSVDLRTGTGIASHTSFVDSSMPLDVVDQATGDFFYAGCGGFAERVALTGVVWHGVGTCSSGSNPAAELDGDILAAGDTAYDAATGGSAPPVPTAGVAAASGDELVVADGTTVTALQQGTRRVFWQVQLGAAATAPPIITGGQVLAFDAAGDITRIDATTGVVAGVDPGPVTYASQFITDLAPAAARGLLVLPTGDGFSVLQAAEHVSSLDDATPFALPAPLVTRQPLPQTAVAGNPVSVTATAVDKPLPTVQWQGSVDGGTTWFALTGATGTTLRLPSVSSDQDGGLVRAVFADAAGTTTASAAARLSVRPAPGSPPATVTRAPALPVVAPTAPPVPVRLSVTARPSGLALRWTAAPGTVGPFTVTVEPAGRTVTTTATSLAIGHLVAGHTETVTVTSHSRSGGAAVATSVGRPGVPWSVRRLGADPARVAVQVSGAASTTRVLLQARHGRSWVTLGPLSRRAGSTWRTTVPRRDVGAVLRVRIEADPRHIATVRPL